MIYEITELKSYQVVAESIKDIDDFPLFKNKIQSIVQIGSKEYGRVGIYIVTVYSKSIPVWGSSDLPNGGMAGGEQ